MTYDDADRILASCDHSPELELTSGRHVCQACYQAYHDARRQARREELGAMARCECCQRRATKDTFGVLLCGHHFNNVNRMHRQAMSKLGGLGLFASPNYPRQTILKMAKEETTQCNP